MISRSLHFARNSSEDEPKANISRGFVQSYTLFTEIKGNINFQKIVILEESIQFIRSIRFCVYKPNDLIIHMLVYYGAKDPQMRSTH